MRDVLAQLRSDGLGRPNATDAAPARQVATTNRESGAEVLTLPPDLERYLPPSLWRQISVAPPRRGLLLNALERLRSILYLLSTYLPQHLVQEKMRRPLAGQARGQWLTGSLLFADVSGFTALSERLAGLGQAGAELLTRAINDYFTAMLDILAQSGGILLKFAGDALLAYFPGQEGGEQARWAVRAGQRMMAAMAAFAAIDTPFGPVGLRMKIGIGTGGFLGASVGSAARMEYVVLGETVAQTMAAEGAAEAGQVVADGATAAHLTPACCAELAGGFHRLDQDSSADLGTYEIKAETRRARGAIPWSASPHALAAQMEVVLRQIQALVPYLSAELVGQIVGHARQRQVQSENRPATVMFVNFTGLEPLLAAWGEAGVRRVTGLLDDYFRAMHGIIAGRGGVVSRIDPYSQGSKMLVLFGAPVAHEDDPLRAVGVALAMNEELARLNERWRRQLSRALPDTDAGPLLQQRFGLTQGPTFAGQAGSPTRREYTVMGDDVNLAARLMSAAQPGQILVSQRIYDAVVEHISATALPPIRVKGKSQPIPLYEPTAARDDPLARRLQQRGALLGREAEMEQVWAVLRAAQSGQGSVLTIEGPAGVGKSHLADRLTALALARDFRAVLAPCQSFDAGTPFAPWITALLALLGSGPADSAAAREAKFWRGLESLQLAAEHADSLRSLLGVQARQAVEVHAPPQPAGRPAGPALFARLEQKVAQAEATQEPKQFDLWQLVRERPLDSAQGRRSAPSKSTWRTLQARVAARQQERLFRAVDELLALLAAQAPLLLYFESAQWLDPASRELLSYLGESLARLRVLVLVVQRSDEGPGAVMPLPGAVLALGPLDLAGTAALASHLLGEKVDSDLARAIFGQSGGNPLFVEEIVRWLQRGGPSARDDLRQGLGVSSTVQTLVLSRLDSLPLSQRDTARAASVVGAEFCRGEVRALWPPVNGDDSLGDDLAGLEDMGLVYLAENGDKGRYAFRQTVVREVGYYSLSAEQRRTLHARLAAYLEAQHAGDLEARAELLAHHYEAAESFLPAAHYLLLAGHKARQRYAYPQATACYDRALAALAHLPVEERDVQAAALQAQAHESRGDVALLTGAFAAAAEAYEAALSALQSPLSNLHLKLALVLPTQDRTAEAVIHARQAWADRTADDELAAAATLAWLLWRSDEAEAGDWIERAAALARREADPWASGIATLVSDLAGDWQTAQRAYLAHDRPAGAALAACREGDRRLAQGDVAGALALYEQAAGLCQAEDDAPGLALAHYRQAEAHLRAGEPTTARAALLQARALLADAPASEAADRQLVELASQAVEAAQTAPWPPWRWQRYDDALRISTLLRT